MRPIGPLLVIVRVQCKLRRIEAKMWEASNAEFFFLGHAGAWRRSECATADGHAVATIFCDLVTAFDRVAYQKLTDAAVRTCFPVWQLRLAASIWSLTAWQGRLCKRNAASFQGARLRRKKPCPSVSWSMTSHCSVLATTTAREYVRGGQANARRVRDSHQEVRGSKQPSLRVGKAADVARAARHAGNAGRAKSREASVHSSAVRLEKSIRACGGPSGKSPASRRCRLGEGWRTLRTLQCRRSGCMAKVPRWC